MTEWRDRKVTDVMSSPVKVLYLGTTLGDAVQFLSDDEITGAPVVNQAGEPIGVVSRSDIVAFLMGRVREVDLQGGYYFHNSPVWEREDVFDANIDEAQENILGETLIDEIMTRTILSILPEDPLEKAILKMVENKVHRLLVVDSGEVTGVVTTMDIMATLVGKPQPSTP